MLKSAFDILDFYQTIIFSFSIRKFSELASEIEFTFPLLWFTLLLCQADVSKEITCRLNILLTLRCWGDQTSPTASREKSPWVWPSARRPPSWWTSPSSWRQSHRCPWTLPCKQYRRHLEKISVLLELGIPHGWNLSANKMGKLFFW